MITEKNIEKAKQQIKKTKDKPIIVQAQDDNFNRKLLEFGKFDILLSIEQGDRKNKLRQIDSGLNHVLAKIATKNNISLGINLREIRNLSKSEKAKRLSKLIQNIKICKKFKTKIKLLKIKNKKNENGLLLSLGASTMQSKESSL